MHGCKRKMWHVQLWSGGTRNNHGKPSRSLPLIIRIPQSSNALKVECWMISWTHASQDNMNPTHASLVPQDNKNMRLFLLWNKHLHVGALISNFGQLWSLYLRSSHINHRAMITLYKEFSHKSHTLTSNSLYTTSVEQVCEFPGVNGYGFFRVIFAHSSAYSQ